MTEVWAFLQANDSLPWAIVATISILILTGRLKPRSDLEEKNREAERWRKAYELEREARAKAVDQNDDLLEVAKTTRAIVTALFDNARSAQQSGGEDVVDTQKSTRRRR